VSVTTTSSNVVACSRVQGWELALELPGDEMLVDESESEDAESSRQVNQWDAFHYPLI
jgi:hypothetical protein